MLLDNNLADTSSYTQIKPMENTALAQEWTGLSAINFLFAQNIASDT